MHVLCRFEGYGCCKPAYELQYFVLEAGAPLKLDVFESGGVTTEVIVTFIAYGTREAMEKLRDEAAAALSPPKEEPVRSSRRGRRGGGRL